MNQKKYVVLLSVLLMIILGGVKVRAQGTLTLEGLSEQVSGLISRMEKAEETDQRLEAKFLELESRVFKLEPTPTPVITVTPTPSVRDKMIYDNQVLRILFGDDDRMGFVSAMETIGTLFFRASENSTLLYNEEWIVAVMKALEVLKATYSEGEKLEPPDSMRSNYDKLIEGLSFCDTSADLLVKWLESYNPEFLEEGARLLDLCGQALYEEMRLE